MPRPPIRALVLVWMFLLLVTLIPPGRGSVAAQSPQPPPPVDPAPFARLAGTASPDGVAQSGLRVELAQDGVRPEATTTDADGAYFFALLEAGTYTVTAFDGTGLPFASETLRLTSGETLYVDLGEPLRQHRAASLANDEKSPCTYVAPPPGTAIIRGTVTDALTGQPLSNVYVTASGPRFASATTSATGTYTLTELAAGAYRVSFDPPSSQNYLGQYYNGKDASGQADLVQVAEGATLTNINAALTPGAIISGRVSGVSNAAISNVTVMAYRIEGETRSNVRNGSTSNDGSFTIDRLPAGTYQIETRIDTSASETVKAYLDGTSNNVSVAASSTNPNVNLSLVRGAQFSGRITDANGAGISNVTVDVYDATNNRFVKEVAKSDYATGNYTSLALPAGSYKIRFESSSYGSQVYLDTYYNNQPSLELATPLALSTATVTPNINAQLTLGGVITGTVTGVGGVPVRGVRVVATSTTSNGSYEYTSTDDDGTYELGGLATGQYRVEFDPFDASDAETQRYLGEYYNNQSTSTTANLVAVTAATTVANINAELTRGAIISGCVSGSDTGRGISDPDIDVYLDSGGTSTSIATRNGSYGTYRTEALLPGSYRITFNDRASNNDPQPGYVRQDYPAPVVVATDNRTGIDAVLERGGAFRGTLTGLDGTPLDEIRVSIYDANGYSVGFSTYTYDGVYTTPAVAPGRYTLELSPYSSSPSAAYIAVEIGPFDATLNAFTIVNHQMSLGGQISGRITNRAGAALSDVSVDVYDEAGDYLNSTSVDDTGVYTTTGLAPGNYRLEFRPFTFGDANQYAPQFYNNKPDLASADPVTVSEMGIIPNINAALDIGSVIAGRVTAVGGAALGEVAVLVYNAEGRLIRDVRVAEDGSYSTPALASGSYRLCFNPQVSRLIAECYDNQANPESATPIVVTAPTPVENINAELAVGSQLKGRVLDAAGAGVAGVEVWVMARTNTAQANPILAWAFSASDGSYTTTPGLPAGTYQLSFIAPTGSNLGFGRLEATVASSGTDVTLADVTLTSVRRVYLPVVQR